jgi:hypothetical protein
MERARMSALPGVLAALFQGADRRALLCANVLSQPSHQAGQASKGHLEEGGRTGTAAPVPGSLFTMTTQCPDPNKHSRVKLTKDPSARVLPPSMSALQHMPKVPPSRHIPHKRAAPDTPAPAPPLAPPAPSSPVRRTPRDPAAAPEAQQPVRGPQRLGPSGAGSPDSWSSGVEPSAGWVSSKHSRQCHGVRITPSQHFVWVRHMTAKRHGIRIIVTGSPMAFWRPRGQEDKTSNRLRISNC